MNNLYPLKISAARRPYFKKGKLIALEGIDGSGKSSLAELVAEKLNQKNYKTSVFFNSSGDTGYWDTVMDIKRSFQRTSSPFPNDVDQVLHTLEFLTYSRIILPELLLKNDFVIADRYALGKIVISRIDTNYNYSLAERMIRFSLKKLRIPYPDITIYLQTNVATARDRIIKRGRKIEFKETATMLNRATNEFGKLIKADDLYSSRVIRVLTTSSLEKVSDKIVKLVKNQ